MTQTRLGRWSELSQIVSAAAVVASLVYVGVEIRSNTEAARAATRQAISDTDLEFIGGTLDPLTLLAAEAKLEAGLELNETERFILVERQHLNFRIFENAHYQFRAGLLEEERWLTYRWIIRSLLATSPPADSMWSKYGPAFDSGFREEVEIIRSEPFVPR